MSLSQETKQDILKKFGKSENDTGSSQVQIALLTSQINHLQGHFKKHIHDFHSKRGLLKMVSRRRRLLSYLKKTDNKEYLDLIAELKLRR